MCLSTVSLHGHKSFISGLLTLLRCLGRNMLIHQGNAKVGERERMWAD